MGDFESFCNVFGKIVRDLVHDPSMETDIPEGLNRLEQLLRNNVYSDSQLGGFAVPKAFSEICETTPTCEQVHLSYILGWCWQMLQVLLKMISESEDKLAGHKDAILLQQSVYRLLCKYFGASSNYAEIINYFSCTSYEYMLGKDLDEQLTKKNDHHLNGISMANWLVCCRYIHLKCRVAGPLQLALMLAGRSKERVIWKRVEEICENLNEMCTVRENLNGSFGEKGVACTDADIKLGRCSWLAAKAKEVGSSAQWYTIKDGYGHSDMVSVVTIKGLYRILGIPELCTQRLEELNRKVIQDTEALAGEHKKIGKVLKELVDLH